MDDIDLEPEEIGLGRCGICGESHECVHCDLIEIKHYILDTPVLSRARLSLPESLKIITMSDGIPSIKSSNVIEIGTRFGPYEAKKLINLGPEISFPLKIHCKDDYFKEYYLDNSSEDDCNWMYFVQAASNLEEQNLICYEEKSSVYFVSMKKILPGQHLKVWYSDYYGKRMNKGSLCNEVSLDTDEEIDLNELVRKRDEVNDRKVWICKFCEKEENDIMNFAIHIREHYNMQLRKICELCKTAFQSRISLKKHMSITHSNESYASNISLENKIPKTCNNESPVQTVKDNVLGDPLLNETTTDIMDQTNGLFEHMLNFNINHTDSLLENDNLQLGVENLLSENENFNFNLDADQSDKFVCDICLKSFTKLKLLVRHLEAHTAKFVCDKCYKVFTRKENLVSHSCNGALFACEYCDKTFTLKKYLNRHIIVKHKIEFVCKKDCKRAFTSSKTLNEHECVPEKRLHTCNLCQKDFHTLKNLKRHMYVHYRDIKHKNAVSYICEICSKTLSTKKFLTQHLKSHKEPEFSCSLCNKKFLRKPSFLEHMEIHKKDSPHTCTICQQKFTLKRYLTAHMAIHKNDFKYKCTDCGQQFRQKSNLKTHYKRMHHKQCPLCDESFDTSEKLKSHSIMHYDTYYKCPICKHLVKLKSSLQRHFKKKHPNENIDFHMIEEIVNDKYKEDVKDTVDNNNTCNVENTGLKNNDEENHQLENRPYENKENKNENEEYSNKEVENKDNNTCDDIVELLKLRGKDECESMQDIDCHLDYIVNSYDTNNLIDSTFNNKNESCKNLDDSILDFNSIEMEFEKNFNTVVESNQQEICLSMPELSDVGQNITFGQNAYMLENGNIVEPLEQGNVVLYVLDKNEKNTS